MQQRRHFHTVKKTLVHALVWEKAGSWNTHPDVFAQVDAIDTGSKQKLSEIKVEILSTKPKQQQEEGQFEAIRYFNNIKENKLTWSEALFNN